MACTIHVGLISPRVRLGDATINGLQPGKVVLYHLLRMKILANSIDDQTWRRPSIFGTSVRYERDRYGNEGFTRLSDFQQIAQLGKLCLCL